MEREAWLMENKKKARRDDDDDEVDDDENDKSLESVGFLSEDLRKK